MNYSNFSVRGKMNSLQMLLKANELHEKSIWFTILLTIYLIAIDMMYTCQFRSTKLITNRWRNCDTYNLINNANPLSPRNSNHMHNSHPIIRTSCTFKCNVLLNAAKYIFIWRSFFTCGWLAFSHSKSNAHFKIDS